MESWELPRRETCYERHWASQRHQEYTCALQSGAGYSCHSLRPDDSGKYLYPA